MRYVLLFLLLVMSSGCVLNQPKSFVYITETHNSKVSSTPKVPTKTIKETPAKRPARVVTKKPVQPTNTTCAAFVLPPAGEMPSRPVFSSPELNAQVEVDEDLVLVAHIKALEDYANREREVVSEAYRQWKKSCK
jgi:hypothetical protein